METPSVWQGSVIDLESAIASQGMICDRPQWYGTPMGTLIRLSPSAKGGRAELAPLSNSFIPNLLSFAYD